MGSGSHRSSEHEPVTSECEHAGILASMSIDSAAVCRGSFPFQPDPWCQQKTGQSPPLQLINLPAIDFIWCKVLSGGRGSGGGSLLTGFFTWRQKIALPLPVWSIPIICHRVMTLFQEVFLTEGEGNEWCQVRKEDRKLQQWLFKESGYHCSSNMATSSHTRHVCCHCLLESRFKYQQGVKLPGARNLIWTLMYVLLNKGIRTAADR